MMQLTYKDEECKIRLRVADGVRNDSDDVGWFFGEMLRKVSPPRMIATIAAMVRDLEEESSTTDVEEEAWQVMVKAAHAIGEEWNRIDADITARVEAMESAGSKEAP